MRLVAIAFLACLSAAAAGCTYNPATGRSQLLILSPQEEIALGDSAKPQLVEQYGGEAAAQPLRAYVSRVGRAVAARAEPEYRDLPWEFTVLDSEVVNAFALPGGKVFISRGLLQRLDSEAQVAAVLGHEIGHVTGQHVDERITQQLLLDLGLTAASGATESQVVYYGTRIFAQGYTLSFSRDQESEADELGLRYMTAAGYAPKAMLDLLRVLEEAGSGSGIPEFLSTHPHPETRMATVGRLLDGPYRYTVDNPEFQEGRDRFQREAAPHL